MAKGPKTLNPADKARKEARKKELKKNKKQRQQVRSAAIECRDPQQIISELEQLDKQEFSIDNYRQQSSSGRITSDILFKDKRKRLKELYARILAHYEKEDPEKHARLKALEAVYEAKHKGAQRDFEAVKAAQEVRIEDVFLPPEQDEVEMKQVNETSISSASQGERVALPSQLPNFKHLLASHKTPPPAFASSRFLPANQRKRVTPADSRLHLTDRPTSWQASGDGHQPAAVEPKQGTGNKSNIPDQQEPSKPAVIESKPVIFVPKVTKFVPASVRSKLSAARK